MISQMSGPNARAARRPDGPSLKITPGWSAIRSPSSMSRCASAEVVEPAVAPARRRNRASRAASKRIERGEVMYYIVTYALQRFGAGWRAPGCLCVPITSSTSCDQVIFVDQAIDVSLSSDAVQVEVDRLGERFQRRGAAQGAVRRGPCAGRIVFAP